MEFGLNLRNFMADPKRPMHDQIEETAELLSLGEELGFWGGLCPRALGLPPDQVGVSHASTGPAGRRRVQDQTDNRRAPYAFTQSRRYRGTDHSLGPDFPTGGSSSAWGSGTERRSLRSSALTARREWAGSKSPSN